MGDEGYASGAASTERTGWGLRSQLVALVVVVATIAIAPVSYYFIAEQQASAREAMDQRQRSEREELQAKGLEMAQSVGRSSERAIATMDFLFLTEVIDTTVSSDDDVVYGIIMDKQRRALMHSNKALANNVLDQPADQFAADQIAAAAQTRTINGEPILELVSPIVVADERWGAVRFGLSLRRLNERAAADEISARRRMRQGVISSIIAAGAIALFGALIGAVFAGRIANPLSKLLDGVRNIRDGHLEQRVEAGGAREVVELASAYNEMTGRLSSVLSEMATKVSLERELEVARSVQENMLPDAGEHDVAGFKIVGHCEMAENCGGDWWAFQELADGRLLVMVGDATGHGLPAAIIAATARGALRACASVGSDLTAKQALEALHTTIFEAGRSHWVMTACAVVLDPNGTDIEFANAGHVMPLTLRMGDSGKVELGCLAARGNPLGSPEPCVGVANGKLAPGQTLMLMTDGLYELTNGAGDMYGDKRLRKLLRKGGVVSGDDDLCKLRDDILGAVGQFGADTARDDDLTLVLLKSAASAASLAAKAS